MEESRAGFAIANVTRLSVVPKSNPAEFAVLTVPSTSPALTLIARIFWQNLTLVPPVV